LDAGHDPEPLNKFWVVFYVKWFQNRNISSPVRDELPGPVLQKDIEDRSERHVSNSLLCAFTGELQMYT
jgi:hypothetical protein